eukprot:s4_g22.t1
MSPDVAEAMASEKGSMETPPSEEKAVNQPRELGGELVPVGEPVVFGPPVPATGSTEVALAKTDVLASLRSSFLPAEGSGGDLSGVVAVSPQRPTSLKDDLVTRDAQLQYLHMMEGAARALTLENQQLKEERERLRSLVNFFDGLQRGDPDVQGQQPGAVPTGLNRAAQAVVAGGTSLLEKAGMSLLGVAGAVTDKVMSASLGKTPVGKDLNNIFDSHATEPHGLLAGVGSGGGHQGGPGDGPPLGPGGFGPPNGGGGFGGFPPNFPQGPGGSGPPGDPNGPRHPNGFPSNPHGGNRGGGPLGMPHDGLVEMDLLEEDRLVVDLVMTLGSILEHCNRFLSVLLVINRCALSNFLIYKSWVRGKWVL